ncbi:MAG: PD-(D/E)XK nuclease family protein [Burkholderiaceae bacterium]
MVETLEIRLGKAFHALMEQLDRPVVAGHWADLAPGQAWVDRLLAVYALMPAEQLMVCQAVQAVMSNHRAREVLLPAAHQDQLLIEVDCLDAEGRWLRPDRVLISKTAQSVTVIDFKWRVLPSEHQDYAQQLLRYGQVMTKAYPDCDLKMVLIDAQAGVWLCQGGELVHC